MTRAVGRALPTAALLALLMVGCDRRPEFGVESPGIALLAEKSRGPADVARIGDTFGRPEDDGVHVSLRTDPSSRAGHYYFVQLDFAPPAGSSLVLQVVRKEGVAAERHVFALTRLPAAPFGEFAVGLTGAQAGPEGWRPVAWRLSVVDASGRTLAARHSFLWGTPDDGR
ncbi:MAG: hypothetical protein ACO3ND_01605 [Opitutales bacterium]